MKIIIFLLLAQTCFYPNPPCLYPLANQNYQPALPGEPVLFPTGGAFVSGCTVNIETGQVSCGAALPAPPVSSLSIVIQ